ncbi:MAG: FAD-dependent thymidylate synthase [bacterium]|nr:FAD-dependent thymidylate synthase [bacterium]MDT8366564.1 FAD-dependent thymidylate synthase [bacterium]
MSKGTERLERIQVPELEEILGQAFPVLDDGFVRLIDYMGNDDSIVQAARVSYGKGTKSVSDDRGLLRYLMRHRHTTPFEMCEVKLHVRVPMDLWRQWIRHRTANVNEYSTRYSLAIDRFRTTQPDQWRLQSEINRQGSEGGMDTDVGQRLTERETQAQSFLKEIYDERIERGVAREQARKDLPLSTYTEAYWKIDLHNLLHFLNLRMDHKAQLEIREYAETIGEKIVQKWVPLAWEAFMDYRHGSVSLSSDEVAVLALINSGQMDKADKLLIETGFTVQDGDNVKPTLEGRELAGKMERMGVEVPWGKS